MTTPQTKTLHVYKMECGHTIRKYVDPVHPGKPGGLINCKECLHRRGGKSVAHRRIAKITVRPEMTKTEETR